MWQTHWLSRSALMLGCLMTCALLGCRSPTISPRPPGQPEMSGEEFMAMQELTRRAVLDPDEHDDALPEFRPVVEYQKRQNRVWNAIEEMR